MDLTILWPPCKSTLDTPPTLGSFHEIVNLKNSRSEIVFDRFWFPLSTILLAALGAKLIGSHGGLQVDKYVVTVVTDSVE